MQANAAVMRELSLNSHPYTAGLLRCLSQAGLGKDKALLATIPGFLPNPGL